VGVSHIIGGDLCCDGYSLNLFINGSPTAANGEEAPSITGWVEPDRDGPDVDEQPPLEEQPFEGGAMGFPLQTFPPAGLDYEINGFEIELTDFVFYAKEAGLDIDVMSTGSTTGPFIPDGEPDAVGQFTLVVKKIGGIVGDFDGDGSLTINDIDLLRNAVKAGAHEASFDLTADGLVDFTDIKFFVEDPSTLNSYIGDANVDGEFNSSDLVQMFEAGEYEDGVAMNSTWNSGDFTGDGEFDSGDLVEALASGGFELGPKAAVRAVPEPRGSILFLLGLLSVMRCRAK
jgi:hypothetical protein